MRILQLFLLSFSILYLSCSKPETSLPKTLLFSSITPEYLQDTAADWKATGFDGFLLAGIMSDWSTDVWATDGDSARRGMDDLTFQRVKKCNDACRKQGIIDNFVKIAFYSHVPLWTDDVAWEKVAQNFYQVGRFAKDTGCRGIALDIEYVSEQYDLDWEGYDYDGYSESDIRLAAEKRGRELVEAMLQAYPDMVYLTLPEGITFYGPLATDLLIGMMQAMAENSAPGGLHLLTERTYDMTSTLGLIHYAQSIDSKVLTHLSQPLRQYWKQNCSVALGGWPFGYYRKIFDDNGKFLGYSGREEKFGNKVVGSYADKSSRFSVQKFRDQYAGLLLMGKRYCWIYGHGATWWHYSEENVERYGRGGNSTVPVDVNLGAYKSVVQEKWLSNENMRRLSLLVKNYHHSEYLESFNFVKNFKVIGPFGCKNCDNFKKEFPPEQKIDLGTEYQTDNRKLTWQTCSVDSSNGYLDFVKYFHPKDWVCAYAYCKIISPKATAAQIRLGTNDMGGLWFNGDKIISRNIERSATVDDDIKDIHLRPGENEILLKVCNTEGNWGLYLRLTNSEGNALADLEYWPE